MKFEFEVQKKSLPWDDFASGSTVSDPDIIIIREAWYQVYPYATTTNFHLKRMHIKEGFIDIPMKKACKSSKCFIIHGTWNQLSEMVTFKTKIDSNGCSCTVKSVFDFFKSSSLIHLGLLKRRTTMPESEPIVYGVMFDRKLNGEIGRTFFPSVTEETDEDGTEIECGEIHQISASYYTQKTGDPLKITGGLTKISQEAISNSYGDVRNMASKEMLKKLDEFQILIAVDTDDCDAPYDST